MFTVALGSLIFFDDYSSILIVGNSLRDVVRAVGVRRQRYSDGSEKVVAGRCLNPRCSSSGTGKVACSSRYFCVSLKKHCTVNTVAVNAKTLVMIRGSAQLLSRWKKSP